MKDWLKHTGRYFMAVGKLWFTWAFVVIDGVGYSGINLSYISPGLILPPLSRGWFVGLNILGFIIVNIHLFAKWQAEKESLQKAIVTLKTRLGASHE